ncbi:MAG TPA: hypothetical protein VGC32_11815 [Solirubrobacterales bacterium]
MERSRRRRPSPALAVACLALFVALGGTVLAATKIDGRTIEVKSLPGNRVAVASLPGNRLSPGTIPGNRLAAKSIKGDQIDITTLGQVPSADHASSADTARHADTATAADHAADATTINGRGVGCAEGERQFAGACWDVRLHTSQVTIIDAASVCGREGGELPAPFSVLAFNSEAGVPSDAGGEWTSAGRVESAGFFSPIVAEGTEELRPESRVARLHFRCVTPLLR